MIDGETIKVGGKDMALPPLNWKGCKKFYQDITGGPIGAEIMADLLFSALARNYPELTQDQMEEEITPGELMAAIPVLLKLSGFTLGGKPGGERTEPDWDDIAAEVATVTGWTWDYIEDNLTLPRYYKLQGYWSRHPPTHILVAAYLDYQAPEKDRVGPDNPGKIEDLLHCWRAVGGLM